MVHLEFRENIKMLAVPTNDISDQKYFVHLTLFNSRKHLDLIFILDIINDVYIIIILGQLYCLQARPVVTLPPSCFFDYSVPGRDAILFDNSNIVESYSGVTSPLTFSFASHAYEMVCHMTII